MEKGKYKIVAYGSDVGREGSMENQVLTEGGFDDFSLVYVPEGNRELFLKEAENADGICAWADLSEEDYKVMKECEIIVAPAIGADKFDIKGATKQGICIANVPDYCLEEVAVHTLALMLDCCRRITLTDRLVRRGIWQEHPPWPMYRMQGRTYGLVSFGNIPRRVAELVKPFGPDIIAYDPYVDEGVFRERGVEKAGSLKELFERSYFISVHTPRLPSTYHMIGRSELENLREGSIIVVTGRGGVVDEEALKWALDTGKAGCAGLDVIEDEENIRSVLMEHEKVVMTSHTAYYTDEASRELKRKVMEHIISVVRNKKAPENLINKEVLGRARFEKENF